MFILRPARLPRWRPIAFALGVCAGTLAAASANAQVRCEGGTADGFPCDRVDLLAVVAPRQLGAGGDTLLNDVWGWTDPETGREYALVGRTNGIAFVDVTDPHRPRSLGDLAATEGSDSSQWRDVKVFRDHMFVVAGGPVRHGMQVFDLTQLREAREAREFRPAATYAGVASSHNIVINEETGFAYLVGSGGEGETCGGGSHIVDVNDPLNPVFAGCFAHLDTGRRGTGYTHDAQCVIYRGSDGDYRGREICAGGNETHFSFADVTDKVHPVALSAVAYPNIGYAHQGWFGEDHRYFYGNDELDGLMQEMSGPRVLVFDVGDLEDPVLVNEYFGPAKAGTHNLYVRGDRLYMANNLGGLLVLDLTDPATPVTAGSFDTTPSSGEDVGSGGAWSVYPFFESGTILVSSRREGLFLLRMSTGDGTR
ncbi:MAG: choice-of-anchor B family protein [Gemmatimonadales bacterium]|nr:choice-of-anchor B family protein [Gemmatimonadales bacterium]MYG49463.1 choice-of-anchor B family protein [Gemmatimonadales bacterium]MYK02015.1 choice-of-anchor B family protein [Candidatus Palauibacter ramosifaciens]